MATSYLDSFNTKDKLTIGDSDFSFYSLKKLESACKANIATLPYAVRVILESLLRNENNLEVSKKDIENLAKSNQKQLNRVDIPFKPARVILQDFTGVPAVVDLAALRSAMHRLGGDPEKINPQIPVDLVIDHSVQVDDYGSNNSLLKNVNIEFKRNQERYSFLRWGQSAFKNFRVIPPASGIVHQVNLEYLSKVVFTGERDGEMLAYPDSLVGTDSHTTMINGLGVLGWGVGGIEAEAVMLGQPVYMLTPEIIGVKLVGRPKENITATDIVLTVTQKLRERGVVEKLVEFYGEGSKNLTLADRATIGNMAPEYGATAGFFPVDDETLKYLDKSGRTKNEIDLIENYLKSQGLFSLGSDDDIVYSDTLTIDLGEVEASLAGPKRPQDKITLGDMKKSWIDGLSKPVANGGFGMVGDMAKVESDVKFSDKTEKLNHGSVVIAAITSCTNTSNPAVLLAAGLLAKKAVEAGLSVSKTVKTSLAPGSKVVTEYLSDTGLLPYLEKLGFYVVGYGCTTCIGNSGPLKDEIRQAIKEKDLVVSSVLSGNRNFEGRISQDIKANYLASPPLVVAYAIAGTVDIDLTNEALGTNEKGKEIYLKDVWPSKSEIEELIDKAANPKIFASVYKDIEKSNENWNKIPLSGGSIYEWDEQSTYIQEPPFFIGMTPDVKPIQAVENAAVLVKVGESTTTDHISPAGAIAKDAPAGLYLKSIGVEQSDFNSYGSRRGNDRIMTRGTFANIRLKNQLAPGTEGGWTTHFPSGEVMSIYDASKKYFDENRSSIVLAGNDYGMGSSRDWAAKGTMLLGVKAVIAESFERIHRSNLVGMGVLPLQFKSAESPESHKLNGKEAFSIAIDDNLKPGQEVEVSATREDGSIEKFTTICRIDTLIEIDYFRNGGILHTVLRKILKG